MDNGDGATRPGRRTIYDVAEHAGVSLATVSRYLNGSGYVGAKARARIEAAIRDWTTCRASRRAPSAGAAAGWSSSAFATSPIPAGPRSPWSMEELLREHGLNLVLMSIGIERERELARAGPDAAGCVRRASPSRWPTSSPATSTGCARPAPRWSAWPASSPIRPWTRSFRIGRGARRGRRRAPGRTRAPADRPLRQRGERPRAWVAGGRPCAGRWSRPASRPTRTWCSASTRRSSTAAEEIGAARSRGRRHGRRRGRRRAGHRALARRWRSSASACPTTSRSSAWTTSKRPSPCGRDSPPSRSIAMSRAGWSSSCCSLAWNGTGPSRRSTDASSRAWSCAARRRRSRRTAERRETAIATTR